MVEAVADKLKQKVEQFLTKSEEGSLDSQTPEWMVTKLRWFLVFMDGKWVEGAAARAQTRSVEEGIQQQIELVGSRAIYDRVNNSLARWDISSDPYFIREQLLLFKWRVDFVEKFFPIEAGVSPYLLGLMSTFSPMPSPGWWAGGTTFIQFALAGMAFDNVLHQAFHMGENVVNFSQATFRIGRDYFFKYWLVYDDPAEEEQAFHSVHEVGWVGGGYLERVVVALHSQGPPSLSHLAIKRVLELELSQDELPQEVKVMIAEGPDVKLSEVTSRGQHLLEELRKKEKADMETRMQDELDEEAESEEFPLESDEEKEELTEDVE